MHEIERKNLPLSSRKLKFLNEKRFIIFRKVKKLLVLFWKASVQLQAQNDILKKSCVNCVNRDSRSRLEIENYKSESRLDA